MAKYYLGDITPKSRHKLKEELTMVLAQIDQREEITILREAINKANMHIIKGVLNSDEIFKFDTDGNEVKI